MKLRDQLSDGEICRRKRFARNTVRNWPKAPGDMAPKYQRNKADDKLTPFEPVLAQALRTDAHRAKHARRGAKALFAHIQGRDNGAATAPSRTSFVLHSDSRAKCAVAFFRMSRSIFTCTSSFFSCDTGSSPASTCTPFALRCTQLSRVCLAMQPGSKHHRTTSTAILPTPNPSC